MSWEDILKIDMREARRLGKKYAPRDMSASSPRYIDLKRRLEALLPIDDKKVAAIIRFELESYLEDGDKDSLDIAENYIKRIEKKGGKK
jgi:hypothetical protein